VIYQSEGHEIQYWQGLVLNYITLKPYKQIKPSFGEEVYFKFNLPVKISCRWIQLRANWLSIKSKQKMLNKKLVDPEGRYVCPLCKDEDEDLDHFLRKYPVLSHFREKYLHGIFCCFLVFYKAVIQPQYFVLVCT
jgi:hypothetical protein